MNRNLGSTVSAPRTPSASTTTAIVSFTGLNCLAVTTLLLALCVPASAVTKTVCPKGPPYCDYRTITEAVNSATYPLTQPLSIHVKTGIYRERVVINNKDGTASNPFLIRAIDGPGTSVVDGSDSLVWTNVHSTIWSAYYQSNWTPSISQVFVDSIRYKYMASLPPTSLAAREWTTYTSIDTAYINTGGIDPNTHNATVTNTTGPRQRGFEVDDSEYLTIDGFTVRRCREEGIRVRGVAGTLNTVIIKNSTSAENAKKGIHLQDCTNCSVENNRARDNGKHGIYLLNSSNGLVARNYAYRNDDVGAAWGGQAGIKIGESSTPSNVNNVTVEYNIAYDNEDTGIDLAGASNIVVRGNFSYRNGDHGYDNLHTDQTTFVGNVAARNNHDGMSIEENATNVTVRNCIFALNAVWANTLADVGGVREMFVDTTSGFQSNYNVIVGLPAFGNVGPGYSEHYRRLVEIRSTPSVRLRYNTLQGYKDSTFALDENSKAAPPAFADSSTGNFRPWWSSSAIDAADSATVYWTATDASGVARHDCAGKINTGNPAGAYGDIGPLEYDDGMSPVDSVGGAYNSVSVGWTATGRYGNTNWKPVWYKLYVDGILKRTRVASNMQWPGYIVEAGLSASPCGVHNVYVRTMAESLSASLTDVTQSNTVTVTTCCSPGCSDRPELAARRGRVEAADVPLALEWVGGNPSTGVGSVRWSIPPGAAGAAFELEMFDVAGRRVGTVARGIARSGSFTADAPKLGGDGGGLRSGVFFLRLSIGRESLTRRVVIIQ